MKKEVSDDLYKLIKSMSTQEKVNFKLFAGNKNSDKTIYLRLFDIIDKQNEYDEIKIFKKDPSIKKKQIGNLKNYLYNLILQSLELHQTSLESTFRSYVSHIEILFEKGLLMQCKKIIKKARILAEKHERSLTMVNLLYWEIKILANQHYEGVTEKTIDDFYESTKWYMNKYSNFNDYTFYALKLYSKKETKGLSRKLEDVEEFRNALADSLFESEEKALSLAAKLQFYSCYSLYYTISNDYQNCYVYRKKILELQETNPHWIEQNLILYKTALCNLADCCADLKKYDEQLVYIKKINEILVKFKIPSLYFRNNIIASALLYEIILHTDTGEFKKATNLIETDTIDIDSSYAIEVQPKITWLYLFAYSYFGIKNYATSKIYINEILNNSNNLRTDTYCMAKIMNMIIYYELNDTMLDHIIRSTYRFLLNKNRLYKIESVLIEFFRTKIFHINTKKKLIEAFKELKEQIQEISTDPFEGKILLAFDFISWLESKIQNRPFAEIVKEKVKTE